MLLPQIGEAPGATSGARNSSVRASASAVRHLARPHPREQTGRAMLLLVPVVHPREHLLGLMDRNDRTFGNDGQLLVGHDRGDFDDDIGIGLQARHFQVDPDQMVCAGHIVIVVRSVA